MITTLSERTMKRNQQRPSRREVLAAIIASVAGAMGAQIAHAAVGRYQPVQLENGQYTQSWFLNSFLELPDDLEEAKSRGRRFAILWEQDGCPYCRETHLTNLAIPEISDFIRSNFDILQLDIWGGRDVVDRNRAPVVHVIEVTPHQVSVLAVTRLRGARIVDGPGVVR